MTSARHQPAEVPTRLSAVAHSQPGTATHLAERTIIGHLIRHPDHINHLQPWLHPRDFATPGLGAIFAAVTDHNARQSQQYVRSTSASAGHNVRDIAESMSTDTESVLGQRTLLFDLATDAHTISSDQLHRYGQMVLEMSARRQLERWGVRLEHAVNSHRSVGAPHSVTTETHAAIMDRITALDAQLRTSRGQPTVLLDNDHTVLPTSTPRPPPPPRVVERAERCLIRSAIADPAWRTSGVLDRLEPEDFVSSDNHRVLWKAIKALVANGQHIDPITVAWQAEADFPATSATATNGGITPDQLQEMWTPPTGANTTATALSRVMQSARAHHVRQAQDLISQAAADRTLPVADALDRARGAADTLHRHTQRLNPAAPRHATIKAALAGQHTTNVRPVPSTVQHSTQRQR